MTTLAPVQSTELSAPADGSDDVRLSRRDTTAHDGFLDGGWWPHSLDLEVELPPLLRTLRAEGLDIRRVTYQIGAWGPTDRRLKMDGRIVKVGGYTTQLPDTITLVGDTGWDRTEIAVIPPGTDPAQAGRALALAGTVGDIHHADQILELAR